MDNKSMNHRNIYPKIFGIVLVLSVFFFLAVPLRSAHAFVDILATLIAGAILEVVLLLIITVTNFILALAVLIVNWAASPIAVSLPYTSGGIVGIGWPIMRDLANMFLVLVLIVIGLGTILRVGEYQVQKLLPTFIGVALLINFTPVIVGIIIDGSNIAMNFFLNGFSGGGGFDILGRSFGNLGNTIANSMGGISFLNPLKHLELIVKFIVIIFFNLMASMILFLFAALFIARYVALWILVILSPVAFVALILPGTKSWFTQWWNQLLQWSIVGVAGAFFLYLSGQIMIMAQGGNFTAPIPPNQQFPISGMLNELLPYAVIMMLMFAGFFISIASGAMGAKAVTSNVQRTLQKAPGWIAKRRFVQQRLGRAAKKAPAVGPPSATTISKIQQFKLGPVPVGKVIAPIVKGAKLVPGYAVAPLLRYAQEAQKMPDAKEINENIPPEQLAALYGGEKSKKPFQMEGLTKIVYKLAKLGKLGKFTDKEDAQNYVPAIAEDLKDPKGRLLRYMRENYTPDVLKTVLPHALDSFARMDERLVADLVPGATSKDDALNKVLLTLKTPEEADRIKNAIRDPATREKVINMAIDVFGAGHFARMAEIWPKEIFEMVQNELSKLSPEEIYKRNPRLLRHIVTSPAGRQWGVTWRDQFTVRGRKSLEQFEAKQAKAAAAEEGEARRDTEAMEYMAAAPEREKQAEAEEKAAAAYRESMEYMAGAPEREEKAFELRQRIRREAEEHAKEEAARRQAELEESRRKIAQRRAEAERKYGRGAPLKEPERTPPPQRPPEIRAPTGQTVRGLEKQLARLEGKPDKNKDDLKMIYDLELRIEDLKREHKK